VDGWFKSDNLTNNGAIMHPILYFQGNNIKDEGKQENICASEY